MSLKYGGIYMFSASAIPIGIRVAGALSEKAWQGPDGLLKKSTIRYLPHTLAPFITETKFNLSPFCLFSSIRNLLAEEFFHAWAHIFIGACGIAVRAIAPFLSHKSKDPPVIVIEPTGKYVISLLSGHWGGGNDLTRHLAKLLNACPVISTASENEACPALDLYIRNNGLKIIDWPRLASFQGRLLRGERLNLYDPGAFLGSANWADRIDEPEDIKYSPLISVDWQKRGERDGLLRLVPPLFCLGFGFRKGVKAEEMLQALYELCSHLNISYETIALCATIEEKSEDTEAQEFAKLLGVKLESFSAQQLAAIDTPNPSLACAKRFLLPPFSVCESAAIAGVNKMLAEAKPKQNMENEVKAMLYASKFIYNKKITMALALSGNLWKRIAPVK